MDIIEELNDEDGFCILQIPDDLEEQQNAYDMYCKIYSANALMRKKVGDLRKELNSLKGHLDSLSVQREKRSRKKADDVLRLFTCEYCDKAYGSEASLKFHLKSKHK